MILSGQSEPFPGQGINDLSIRLDGNRTIIRLCADLRRVRSRSRLAAFLRKIPGGDIRLSYLEMEIIRGKIQLF